MKLFVRSRSQSVARGRGYFWQPTVPDVATRIEAHQELVSDYSRTLLIWTHYEQFGGAHYHLYLSGLDAGAKDDQDRPIKHTLVWESDSSRLWGMGRRERPIRALAVAYLRDPQGFEARVREHIAPDVDQGFRLAARELLGLAAMEERSLLDNTAPPNLTELGNSVEVADYLSQYSLRDISGQYSADCPEGLLVAVGERFSRSRIQEQDGHPILQLVCDSRSQEAG